MTETILILGSVLMIKKIAIGILILIVGFIAFVATRPTDCHHERSARISAPPDVVFAKINDFHQWVQWSPYEKLDPNMKKTFEGSSAGVGAVYSWAGNDKAGEGRATITESKPGELVSMKLEFFKPFAAICQANFTLVPAEGGTRVTWSMDGKNNFMAKAVSIFMDMDKMIGKDFEEGLVNLNRVTQADALTLRQPVN